MDDAISLTSPTPDPNPDHDTLGARLRRAREGAGMSAGALANALGVRRETVRAWEGDRSVPRATRLIRIAGLLSVSPAWLIQGLGNGPAGNNGPKSLARLREEMRRLVDLQDQMKLAIASIGEQIARAEKEWG